MIWIFNKNKASAVSFDTHEELFSFIEEIENLKLLEEHEEFAQTHWSFRIITPPQILDFHNYTNPQPLKPIAQEACRTGLSYLEICKGNPQDLKEFLLTPEIDCEKLKKQWCLDYCLAHNYLVIENCLPARAAPLPAWQVQAVTSAEPLCLSTLVTSGDSHD